MYIFVFIQAMKKSLFKPAAFFKGFLLPLCEVRDQFVASLCGCVCKNMTENCKIIPCILVFPVAGMQMALFF